MLFVEMKKKNVMNLSSRNKLENRKLLQKLSFIKTAGHIGKCSGLPQKKTEIATSVSGDFHIPLNKDLAFGVCTHGVTTLFVNRYLRLGGMSCMCFTAAVYHTSIDIVEGPQAVR